MTELDLKQRILVAIYTEYQKDLPDMKNNINAEVLGIQGDKFRVALDKLQNEGFIKGTVITRGGQGNKILSAFTSKTMMTRDGIEYVEEKLDIPTTLSANEKVGEVAKKLGAWGYTELKDFAVKVTAEILKG